MLRRLPLLAALLVATVVAAGVARAASPPSTCTNPSVTCRTGFSPDGSSWKIEVPSNWNRTVLLYSHGYEPPVAPHAAGDDGPDRTTADYLLAHGFALVGSSYASNGWAVQEALVDQIDALNQFVAQFGKARRTIAWGTSMGGMITAGLVQRNPTRFDGALPMCGLLAGGMGLWNQNLDLEVALKTLWQREAAAAGPASTLQLVHVTDMGANIGSAEGALAAAQSTASGRARNALASALFNLRGWFTPGSPAPAANDYASQEQDQFSELQTQVAFVFGFRQELEQRAGGNPSWNIGVDYRKLFERSAYKDEVKALYDQAGLDLNADLDAIQATPRIAPDLKAAVYLARNIVFNGEIRVPELTIHTTGDWLVPDPQEQAYQSAVDRAGNGRLLEQLHIDRAGHCTFTDAEMLTALDRLTTRIDTGRWSGLDPASLNASAASYGPGLNAPFAPAYVDRTPPAFLRPFDLAPGGLIQGIFGPGFPLFVS